MHDDALATTREEARKIGGDALVAKLDAANAKEAAYNKQFAKILEDALVGVDDETDRKLSITALGEAFSQALAAVAVRYGQIGGHDDGDIMVLAIKSLTNNLQVEMANRDASKDDIVGKIKKGIARLGKLPDGDA